MRERWVSFDCFGTLVDWHTGFRRILERAGARRAGDLEDAFHRREPEVEAGEYRSYREVTRLALERAMNDLGAEPDVSATAIADSFRARAPRVPRRLPGAKAPA